MNVMILDIKSGLRYRLMEGLEDIKASGSMDFHMAMENSFTLTTKPSTLEISTKDQKMDME